eukprot:CAMPEP_0182924970 /NCGR_PEP_ID=MMETSP0105_2-20130417/8057_1 /TAXON_ID=81532 ORGANISM="Acanthoeca-like sp., Strain 10tr" /NCGR_SAMPLE_ID=MMETSP0105_2 /ASSEMBLY_ACC=CAM_ASM_000205 /LENGTH=472 /DNA_ID=CAMNT_0025062797 /DNA_START=72 /DNA_END=1490 /DNA_ORIENTATION=+
MAAAAARGGPKLISRLYGHHTKEINDALYVDDVDGGDDGGIISIGEDKQLLIWLKRDSGGYWPSVHEELPAPATALAFDGKDRKAYIGLATGVVLIYSIQGDFNACTYIDAIPAHKGRVTGLRVDNGREFLVSCSRDKTVALHSLRSLQSISVYPLPSWANDLDYDDKGPNIFVGDYGGRVHVLKLDKHQQIVPIVPLEGHSGSIKTVLWVRSEGMLYTGSTDKTIRMWDIGSCKGECFVLRGQKGSIDGLAYSAQTKQLIAAGSDKKLLVWNVGNDHWQMPPVWNKADNCEACGVAFFWNFEKMWQDRKLQVNRQHHCRYTGKAVCDTCSPTRTTITTMGFELPVRICKEAEPMITEEDKLPRAKAFPLGNTCTFTRLTTMGAEQVLMSGSTAGEICVWSMGIDVLSAGGLAVGAAEEELREAQADVQAKVSGFEGAVADTGDEDRVAHTEVYDRGYDDGASADLLSTLDE